MPVQLNSVLRERMQITDKKDVIELYYELLSSGHSVGEILEALNSTQSKAGDSNIEAAEYSRAESDRAPTDIAAGVAPVQAAQAKTRRIPDLSTPHAADDDGRAAQAPATESGPLKEREADNGEQPPDNPCGPEPDLPALTGSPDSANGEGTLHPGDQEQVRPDRFSWTARRIAFGTLCATAIVAAVVVGFSNLHGARDIRHASARVPSSVSGGIEAAAVPRAEAARAEAVDYKSDATKQVADAEGVTRSAAQPQPQDIHGSEAGQPNAARLPALAATASDRLTGDAAPATAPTQTLKSAPEAHDTASAAIAGAERRIEGDHAGVPAASLVAAARAEHPDSARPPAREAVAPVPAPRISQQTPFKTAEADALVRRGDAFFAAGDLASARLFYEYAATTGNGAAALRLGGTFDPGFLARAHIGRVQGDAAVALYWYRRARDLGDGDAEILLRKMEKPAR